MAEGGRRALGGRLPDAEREGIHGLQRPPRCARGREGSRGSCSPRATGGPEVITKINNGGTIDYSDPATEKMMSERGRVLWATWPNSHRFMALAEVQYVTPEDVPAAARLALRIRERNGRE